MLLTAYACLPRSSTHTLSRRGWRRFCGALSFNQNIARWAVESVETLYFAFTSAAAFDQDLSSVCLRCATARARAKPGHGTRRRLARRGTGLVRR